MSEVRAENTFGMESKEKNHCMGGDWQAEDGCIYLGVLRNMKFLNGKRVEIWKNVEVKGL